MVTSLLTDCYHWADHSSAWLGQMVELQAAAFGCKADIDWVEDTQPYYPPLVNDKHAYQFAVDVGQR